MDRFTIERRGGFAGLKASGSIDSSALDQADKVKLQEFFKRKRPLPSDAGADRYIFTVTHESDVGKQTIDVPESLLPSGLARIVKEQI